MPSTLFNKSASPTPYLFTILYYLLPAAEGSTGTPGGTRTPDLLLRRQLLYPAELQARILLERVMGIEPTQSAWKAEILPLNYTRIW